MENLSVGHGVKSLYDIVLNFIAKNAANIDNLVNFPPFVGEGLFRRCVEAGVLKTKEQLVDVTDAQKSIKALNTFMKAYPDEVLVSLCITSGLILINEHFDQLKILMTYIKSLDLNSCFLGSYHEMIEHIGSLTLLENLSLRQNCLSNDAIRKITLPLQVFGRGPANLQYLDLSDNPSLNDKMIGWLSRLKELKYLNLTGTSITKLGRQILKEKCNLLPCEIAQFKQKSIITVGWAEIMLDRWFDMIARRLKERITIFNNHKKRSVWVNLPAHQSVNNFCCSNNPTHMHNGNEIPSMYTRLYSNFIFKRMRNIEPKGNTDLHKMLSISEITREDIFSQYRS